MEETSYIGRATYSPEDNKCRIYPDARLPKDLYERVRAAGFIWAPKQELFVAPMWTPGREDLMIELCGEVGDEDTSLVERAEQRAERFEDYSDNRLEDARQAKTAVDAIAGHIPFGQPILVGHHSERRARKDAERIENGMRKAVKMWDQAQYWTDRANGAMRAAKYKERPDVRARRIKKLEAEKRKQERYAADYSRCAKFWRGELKLRNTATGESRPFEVNYENTIRFTGSDTTHMSFEFPLAKYPRSLPVSQYEGSMSLYSALGSSDGADHAIITVEQARDLALGVCARVEANTKRWIAHYENRLAYERAMLKETGGTVADQAGPEVGGACRCWASPGRYDGGWSYIQKVNKVSVTVLDNWGNGGRNFTRTIPFDKLHAIMTKTEVEAKRAAGVLRETADKIGFFLFDTPTAVPVPASQPKSEETQEFEALHKTSEAGVQVVTAACLFPTPPELAERMIDEACIESGHRVLEPSAGTGNIIRAIRAAGFNGDIHLDCIEINQGLCHALRAKGIEVDCRDFMEVAKPYCPDAPDGWDRIIMNPPFDHGSDVRHIQRAFECLRPGGRMVAIATSTGGEGLRQWVEGLGGMVEPLPAGTFKEAGTNVNTCLVVVDKPALPQQVNLGI